MSFDGRSAVATASITVVPDGIVKSWKGPHALACGGTSPVYVVASAPAGLDPAIAPIAASTTATPANTSRNLIFMSPLFGYSDRLEARARRLAAARAAPSYPCRPRVQTD